MKSLKKALAHVDADFAAHLVSATTDIALVMDDDGVIEDVTFSSDAQPMDGLGSWRGRRWSEIVTVESRPKVEELLKGAASKRPTGWRQVNHPMTQGADVPVRYAALRLGQRGRVIALGNDLRSQAALQRKLVDAQQSMEREYARLRQAETRYRLLFKLTTEPVVIVDAATHKIIEANPSACRLIDRPQSKVLNRSFASLFLDADVPHLMAFLGAVQIMGHAEEIEVRMLAGQRRVGLAASLFRQESGSQMLVQLKEREAEVRSEQVVDAQSRLAGIVERLKDGFVVTDLSLKILTANSAFLDLVQLPNEEQVRGEPAVRWIGRTEIDFDVLVGNIKQHGAVRLYNSCVRGELGTVEPVEISAVCVPHGPQGCFGFTMRRIEQPTTAVQRSPDPQLPRSVKQMTELVGQVPLKNLVRETTDIIERLCIEAALELTHDNRVSAAEMLGLSRQSLYSKLRRYGLSYNSSDTDP